LTIAPDHERVIVISPTPLDRGVSILEEIERGEATPTVSAVIPALGDTECLPWVLSRMPQWVNEVVVVSNSDDGLLDVVHQHRRDGRVVPQSGNGKSNALRCGFDATSGDIIVTLDADGSTDPAEMPRFIAALRTGADFAKGTRFISGGGSVDVGANSYSNRALTKLTNRLFTARFSDVRNSYNAFWRRCLPQLSPDMNGLGFETVLPLRALRGGLHVVEVPSYESNRSSGADGFLSARNDTVRVLRTIVAERLRP
jgi:glycosyltransferase involved in cell wall biosynthesis